MTKNIYVPLDTGILQRKKSKLGQQETREVRRSRIEAKRERSTQARKKDKRRSGAVIK